MRNGIDEPEGVLRDGTAALGFSELQVVGMVDVDLARDGCSFGEAGPELHLILAQGFPCTPGCLSFAFDHIWRHTHTPALPVLRPVPLTLVSLALETHRMLREPG